MLIANIDFHFCHDRAFHNLNNLTLNLIYFVFNFIVFLLNRS